jgi:hypothetical protein
MAVDGVTFRGTDRKVGSAVIAVDGLDAWDGPAVQRTGGDGQDFRFAAVGQRVQQRQRAGIIAIAIHVRIENDAGGRRRGGD